MNLPPLIFRFGTNQLLCGPRCWTMGILNVTPDSFSDGGEFETLERAVQHGIAMAQAGADIIDVGGESTRPGARPVPAEEEIRRVTAVIRALAEAVAVPVSIDTTKAETARAALDAGADIVNDVSALTADPKMPEVVGTAQAGCILMHRRGTPETMQTLTDYEDVIQEVADELSTRLERAVAQTGLEREFFMLDPGIGFAKTSAQNLDLIASVQHFRDLGRPVLMGPSRKAFIGRLLQQNEPRQRLWGTAAAVSASVLYGADVVRVHDVAEMHDVVRVSSAIRARH